MTTKICPQCGKEFENKKHPNVKYCSRQCFYDSRKSETVTKTCPICRISFTTRNDKICCSKECSYKYKRKQTERKCENCGKIFYRAPSRKNKYCSQNCYNIGKVILKCQQCGKEFETHKTEPHKHCSVKCANLGSRKYPKTKICLRCQKSFTVTSETRKRRYCSPNCANKSAGQNATKTRQKLNPKFTINCVICDKTILVYRCRQQVTKTCSPKCHRKWLSVQSSKRKNKTHELECEYCGRIFEMWECRINEGRRFCSNTCYHANTSPTTPEKFVSEYLTTNNIIFKEQVKIGRYHIDFLIPDNILIEVYGDYWHAHPDKYDRRSLLPQQKKVYKRDKRRKEFLIQKGYKFFAIWERDIKKDINLALSDTMAEYKQLELF